MCIFKDAVATILLWNFTRKMSSLSAVRKDAFDTQAVRNFCEYLRIASVHPDVNYGKLLFKTVALRVAVFIKIPSLWGRKNREEF